MALTLTQTQLDDKIITILRDVKIPENYIGFKYVKTAIELVVYQKASTFNCKDLYNQIATIYNANAYTVKVHIRKMVNFIDSQHIVHETLHNHFDMPLPTELFYYKLVSSEFIALIAYLIQLKYTKLKTNDEIELNKFNYKLTKLFYLLGIPVSYKGYIYLQKAILLALDNRSLIKPMSQIYILLANIFNDSVSSVTNAINAVVYASAKHCDIDLYNLLFIHILNKYNRHVNNKEFIDIVCDFLLSDIGIY